MTTYILVSFVLNAVASALTLSGMAVSGKCKVSDVISTVIISALAVWAAYLLWG